MATGWRIRHKLLLGLGLVVAVMALLLGGTLRGLWSYWATTNSIRAKLAELRAIDEFRSAVYQLVTAETPDYFRRNLDEVDKNSARALRHLKGYDAELSANLASRSNPGESAYEQGMVQVLFDDLETFHKRVLDEAKQPHFSGPHDAPAAVDGAADPKPRVERKDDERDDEDLTESQSDTAVVKQIKKLKRDTQDLRREIFKQLDTRLSETRRHYQVSLWIIGSASVVGLLVLAGILRSFFVWVFTPIRDLEAGVVRVAQGDFAHRIEVHSGDEMEDLGEAFNDMTRRLQELYGDLARQVNERSRQLVRSERLASVGFLAAGVAHEINNPLASIAFCSEALEARLGDVLRGARAAGRGDEIAVFAKYLKMIQDEAFRCKHITERLLEFSRGGERRRENTDLGALAQSVIDLAQHLQNSRGKQIELKVNTERVPGGRIVAAVNAEEIKSVVLNLVVNALDSMDEGGRMTVTVGQRDGQAVLSFDDGGCGMNQEVLENIFEPFFTRSRTGKGTGLGLTISHRIITQHGGEIEAASAGPGHGSTFTVRLPLQPAEAPEVAVPRRAA